MKDKKFYALTGSTIMFTLAGVASLLVEEYILGSAFTVLSALAFRHLRSNATLTGRKKLKKTFLSFIDSVRELAIISAILVLPMVPKELAVAVIASLGFVEIFRREIESRTGERIYSLIDPDWRIGLLSGMLLIAWYNPFVLYWASWALLVIYIIEIPQILKQLR